MFDIKKIESMINDHIKIQQQSQTKSLEYFERAVMALEDINEAISNLIVLKKRELDPMK